MSLSVSHIPFCCCLHTHGNMGKHGKCNLSKRYLSLTQIKLEEYVSLINIHDIRVKPGFIVNAERNDHTSWWKLYCCNYKHTFRYLPVI